MSTVLLVEDDPDQIELRTLLLESDGHTVFGASTAARARELLGKKPEFALLDLRIPSLEDGFAFIRELRMRCPGTRIFVLTGLASAIKGRPEHSLVDRVLQKPFRHELLASLLRTAALLLVAPLLFAATHGFSLDHAAECAATIEMSAPDAVFAEVHLDGKPLAHIPVFAGPERYRYSIHLGKLAAGNHSIRLDRSASVHSLTIQQPDPAVLEHAPILYARTSTLGRFSDVPLLMYAERLSEQRRPYLQYTVVFSNEDGGTSTRALMARWGRTTDIEHVYRLWTDHATIQTRDHKDVVFTGSFEDKHPLLIVSTDNNMVSPGSAGPMRFRPVPILVDLSSASREKVMDDDPVTYRVAAQELDREKKLRPFGKVEGQSISDPRNYLYVEALIHNRDSRVAFRARLDGSERWYSSHLGKLDYAIERSGWVRSTIELPPSTRPDQVAELAAECLVDKNALLAGMCRLDAVSKVFLLRGDYRPGPPFFSVAKSSELPTGEMIRWILPLK